jgi:hypothetical protein
MRIAFDSIPQEVLENIAFYAVESEPLGPPRELAPLLLVNRRLHAALSGVSNPHLHARIFACKFDSAALVRRLGTGAATARKLAKELRRRFVQLGRLRERLGCTVSELNEGGGGEDDEDEDGKERKKERKEERKKKKGEDGEDGEDEGDGGSGKDVRSVKKDEMTEEGMRALHEMLWTAYVMMLENDGKNERQLRGYAHLDDWLRAFWFAKDGASFARFEIGRNNAWPPYNDLADVTMWLFWFLLRPGASPFFSVLCRDRVFTYSAFTLFAAALITSHHTHTHSLSLSTYAIRTRTHITRGVLCVGGGGAETRNFYIEVVGPRGT